MWPELPDICVYGCFYWLSPSRCLLDKDMFYQILFCAYVHMHFVIFVCPPLIPNFLGRLKINQMTRIANMCLILRLGGITNKNSHYFCNWSQIGYYSCSESCYSTWCEICNCTVICVRESTVIVITMATVTDVRVTKMHDVGVATVFGSEKGLCNWCGHFGIGVTVAAALDVRVTTVTGEREAIVLYLGESDHFNWLECSKYMI